MKTALSFLAACICSLNSFGYAPTLTEQKKWHIYNIGLVVLQYDEFLGGDSTLASGVTYRKLYRQSSGWPGDGLQLVGLLREDVAAEQILFFNGVQEEVVADFSLNVGESINIQSIGGEVTLTVAAVDQVNVNGTLRKRLTFENNSAIWIEGLGSLFGITDPDLGLVTDYFPQVVCLFENDALVWWKDGEEGNCSTVGVSEETVALLMYPVPANAQLNVAFPQTNTEWRIIDQNGRIAATGKSTGRSECINVSALRAGAYTLHARLGNNDVHRRFVVVH